MDRRGALIVFEGCDRSGKSTQSKILLDKLKVNGYCSELIQFPNRSSTTGELINDYLNKEVEMDDHAIHLLFSANRWEMAETILKKLNDGINVILDRYAYSGVVYTSSKKGLDFEWCKCSDIGLPEPDVVFFMDQVSTENRAAFGKERYETREFQQLVYNNFKKIAGIDGGLWVNVDGTRSIEEISHTIFNKTNRLLRRIKHKGVGKLWTGSIMKTKLKNKQKLKTKLCKKLVGKK